MPPRRRSHAKTAAFWKTAVDVAVDRPAALEALETTFRAGSVPSGLDGFCAGRLLATTAGRGLDVFLESLTRSWMPWKGKTFDAARGEGWNAFDPRGRWVPRLLWPRYAIRMGAVEEPATGRRLDAAFRFVTSTGASAFLPGVDALRIDYDLDGNPSWPVRRVLDEVVEVDPGLLLGQALVDLRGRWRRAAWFSLEA